MTETPADSQSPALPTDPSPDSPPSPAATDAPNATGATVPAPEIPLLQSFDELNLLPEVLASVKAAGFTKPTPIQSLFIPRALTGNDVMGQAKTGTGKTAAFLLPIFQQIKPGSQAPQALILAPTRELALQIFGEIGRLGSTMGFSAITLYGGASYEPQIEALQHGVDIIVGTPGRVMDHMRSKRLDLSNVQVAVLDEADRMLDLGFRKDIEYILRQCPDDRQTLLLSATIPEDIRKLSKRFMHDPEEVWTAPENLTVDAVEQHFCVCDNSEKFPVLLKLLDQERPRLAIIFCGTKINAKRVTEKLKRLHIGAREIHGDLQQKKREKIMSSFREGIVKLLIATDVASRGIDVQNVTHIINYDVPYKIEDYVHRIGRTGRMERSGRAFTFITREEGPYLTEIELLINKEISRVHFDDLTSYWWPHPPATPLADYVLSEAAVPSSSDDDMVQPRAGAKGSKGRGGGRGGRSERGGGGDRGGRSDRGSRDRERRPASATGAGASSSPDAAPGSSGGESSAGEGGRRDRRPRRGAPVDIVCAQCGATAQVRFTPDPSRPVYCPACYRAKQAQSTSAAGETKSSNENDTGAKVASSEL